MVQQFLQWIQAKINIVEPLGTKWPCEPSIIKYKSHKEAFISRYYLFCIHSFLGFINYKYMGPDIEILYK